MKLAIFDVDGTLVDSRAIIAASITSAFRAEGFPVPERARMLGIVGLSLDPGGYPDLGLAPGDRVTIVRSGDTAASEATDDSADDGGTSSSNVIAREATVVSVEELTGDRRLVSVLTTEADAEAVAAAAGSGSLRLVQVSP